MEDRLIPIFTCVSEFSGHQKSLIEIGELQWLEELNADYPNLAKGIQDEKELIAYSKEMYYLYHSHLDKEYLEENIYKNQKIKWVKESDLK